MADNPNTAKLKNHLTRELKIYGNFAPILSLMFAGIGCDVYLIYKIMTTHYREIDLISMIIQSMNIGAALAVFGFVIGKFLSTKMQRQKLRNLKAERKKRREIMKEQLRQKEEVIRRFEEHYLT